MRLYFPYPIPGQGVPTGADPLSAHLHLPEADRLSTLVQTQNLRQQPSGDFLFNCRAQLVGVTKDMGDDETGAVGAREGIMALPMARLLP